MGKAAPTLPQLPPQLRREYCSQFELREIVGFLGNNSVSSGKIIDQIKDKWIVPGSLKDVIRDEIGGQTERGKSVLEQAGKHGELKILSAFMDAVKEGKDLHGNNNKTNAVDCAVLGLLQDDSAATLYKFCRNNPGIIHPAFFLAMVVPRKPENTQVFEDFLNEHGQHIGPDFNEKFLKAKEFLASEQKSVSPNESQVESEAKLGGHQGLIDTERSAAFAFEYFNAADILTNISIFDATNSFGDNRLKNLVLKLVSNDNHPGMSEVKSKFRLEQNSTPGVKGMGKAVGDIPSGIPKKPNQQLTPTPEGSIKGKKSVRFADELPTPKPLTQEFIFDKEGPPSPEAPNPTPPPTTP